MSSFDNTESECNICFTQSNKWQLLPCNHKLCKKCFNLLQDTKCPWCRIKIKKNKAPPTSARTRSYSDPLHNRDTLRTPIDVIEHENRIERYMDRKKSKKNKKIKQKVIVPSERRALFNNNFRNSKNILRPELLNCGFY